MNSSTAHSNHYRSEAGRILRLGGPLIANNLAIAGMTLADTVFAGRLSATDLGAVAVGSSVWMVLILFGIGLLMSLSLTTAHLAGAGDHREIGAYARQGFWLSQLVAWVLFAVLYFGSEPALTLIGIDPTLIPVTVGYLQAIAWGLPAIFLYYTLRYVSEGVGWTRPIMYVSFLGLVVNIVGDYVLMYGKFGFPRLGAAGCGWASAITLWTMLLAMFTYVRSSHVYKPFEIFSGRGWPERAKQRELIGLGLPIGIGIVAEAGMFGAVALLMGTLGTTVVAAHQIAINYASTVFMVPLGLAMAITVRVAQNTGAGHARAARHAGVVGIGLCGAFMALSALVMVVFGEQIIGAYTTDLPVRTIATGFIAMAALFQVADGLQVGGAGALRGLKDTRIPMWLNILSYWIVGFPLAWLLGIRFGYGPRAVWVGLLAGLVVAAVLLNIRFYLLSASRIVGTETDQSGSTAEEIQGSHS